MDRRRRDRGQNGREERREAAPVYTAVYKVNRTAELLDFLLVKCHTSRNNVKMLLSNHHVLVNGSVATQYNFLLAKDDEVKISKTPVRGKVQQRTPATAERKVREKIRILYEDDDFIAIDKPTGLLSVESDKSTESAFAYVFDLLQRRDKNLRPYVLHRIDKETSGVLVFAKNVKIHSMLRLNWNDCVTAREYYAVVEGVPEEKEGTIVSYLKENKNNLMYSTQDPTGQKAITHYRTVKSSAQFALLKVNIETGRKNQIRVHMRELGHSVVGDEKYGFTKDPLKRLGLHASALEFVHPVTKQTIRIESRVPTSFRSIF